MGPQMQPGKSKQTGAGTDIGKVAHLYALVTHFAQHGEATGGGGVVAGTKGAAGRDA